MGDLVDVIERLRQFRLRALRDDPALEREVALLDGAPWGGEEGVGGDETRRFEEESIALRRTRPVFSVRGDRPELVFRDREDVPIWKERLERWTPALAPMIRAVGRVELTHADHAWVGTGWLVRDNVLVTNRHVARFFASGEPLGFLPGADGAPIGASVDFKREEDDDARRAFAIRRVLYVEPDRGPDVAFFEVERENGAEALADPIALDTELSEPRNDVAVVGYPARDSRIPEPGLMRSIYGQAYDHKRFAPGAIKALRSDLVLHDCTTLGGNSGSVVIAMDTGHALGLHFSGRFLDTNYAVSASRLAERLERALGVPRRALAEGGSTTAAASVVRAQAGSVTVEIPVRVTVSLGDGAAVGGAVGASVGTRPRFHAAEGGDDDEVELELEAKPSDYDDREGYVADFLGEGVSIPLPTVRKKSDVLTFERKGKKDHVLRYEHFSVVMSKSRRMCFFSAVNIDGASSRRTDRRGWRFDPRIPSSQQILKECYGNPPKFSRGHMTRREDPAWGGKKTAQRGSDDSMHVTNTTPQMQAFNSPIWLALEDYALQNARADAMRISVFTGPYFDLDGTPDPVRHGVRIPRGFFKVIAFLHDETGELTATGYEMSQEANLPPPDDADDEFVFGQFHSPQLELATQVSIASIEARARIRFGRLRDHDPFADEEAVFGSGRALRSLREIRFR